jgi:hypothetical protein
MKLNSILPLLTAAVASACEIPTGPPLSNNITEGFGIRVQNPAWPNIHNRYLNLDQAGGDDQHLYLSPAARYAFDLTLEKGVIKWSGRPHVVSGVIAGEYELADNTTKLFMTERKDPEAIFQPVYGCDPDTDELQVQLTFLQRIGDVPGGHICVRPGQLERHDFRYSPFENPSYTPERPCTEVTLVVDRSGPPEEST